MNQDKKLALLLLKQVLWGVRHGNNEGGICDLYNRRLSRLARNAKAKGIEVDRTKFRSLRRAVMKEAVTQLGWVNYPMFPVPHPDTSDNQHAFNMSNNAGDLWYGRYGQNRMKLLCRMIWVLKTQIFMESK